MNGRPRQMVVSSLWLQVGILTFVVGFAVMGYLAYRINADHPPIPIRVATEGGDLLFTGDDVMAGQHIFQKFGLMQHGTIFGHGAYLGPDFTAQYLHRAGQAMLSFYSPGSKPTPEAQARVKREFKQNAYDPDTGTLVYTAGQAHAFGKLKEFYADYFGEVASQRGVKRPAITDPDEIHRLTSYFSWASWVATAARPGRTIPTPIIGRPSRWPETTSRPKRSSGACSA